LFSCGLRSHPDLRYGPDAYRVLPGRLARLPATLTPTLLPATTFWRIVATDVTTPTPFHLDLDGFHAFPVLPARSLCLVPVVLRAPRYLLLPYLCLTFTHHTPDGMPSRPPCAAGVSRVLPFGSRLRFTLPHISRVFMLSPVYLT